jgi:hypothetical protein
MRYLSKHRQHMHKEKAWKNIEQSGFPQMYVNTNGLAWDCLTRMGWRRAFFHKRGGSKIYIVTKAGAIHNAPCELWMSISCVKDDLMVDFGQGSCTKNRLKFSIDGDLARIKQSIIVMVAFIRDMSKARRRKRRGWGKLVSQRMPELEYGNVTWSTWSQCLIRHREIAIFCQMADRIEHG